MNIIPLGNDYLFIADKQGKIKSLKKFHSRLIPQQVSVNDSARPVSLMHSHLIAEPYISAKDICTFMLYGGYYGINEFAVFSTAFSVIFTYHLDSHSITITEK